MDGLYSRISNSICIPVSVGVWYQIGRIRDPTDRPTDDEHEDEEHCSGEEEKEEEELRKKKEWKEWKGEEEEKRGSSDDEETDKDQGAVLAWRVKLVLTG